MIKTILMKLGFRFKKKTLCCPKCKHPFNDWFTWHGLRYCFLCGPFNIPNREVPRVITEDEGVWLLK